MFKFTRRLLLWLLLGSSVLAQAAKPMTVAINAYLKNFVGTEAEAVGHTELSDVGTPVTIEQLSELKKREIVSSLFFTNPHSQLNQAQCSEILSDNLVSDLNLFTVCDGQSANLFHKLNYTKTVFGELYLIHKLLTPTTDRSQLLTNQALVKALVANPTAALRLEAALKTVQNNQTAFLKLWLEDQESVSQLFYKHKFLKGANRNTLVTSAVNTLNLAGNWAMAHVWELPGIISRNEAVIDQDHLLPSMANKVGAVAKDFVVYNINPKNLLWTPLVNIKKTFSNSTIEEALSGVEKVYRDSGETLTPETRTKFKYLSYGSATAGAFVAGYFGYLKLKFYKERYDRAKVVNELQAQLVAVSAAIRSLDTMREIFRAELGIELAPVTLTAEAQALVADLHKATFDNSSLLYFEGRVLKCYHQIKALKEQLADLFAQIGYVDAYLSAAKLYNSGAGQKGQCCFVDYLDAQTPKVVGVNYWNIMLDPNTVVVNNLAAEHNIILTGANAGGKSTTIKAFMQNILLGQTFGIAAASEFKLTPFTKLITYLNITDDLSNGKSLFKAEVARAQALLATVHSLAPHEFSFCAIDELFTGTAADAGAACAEELVTKLKPKNANFIFATHYQNLTKLAAVNPGRFANYRMLPPTKVNGKIVYPFVIAPGVNQVNVAKDILAEANLI